MDLLWKKEPNGSKFVNIFASINKNSVEKKLEQLKLGVAVELNKKNNDRSTKFRQAGNEEKTKENWRIAMQYYNLSLRYAEIGSENVAFAYANRSLCFLKLGMFDKCVIDIEKAKKANYPKEKSKISKLEDRRAYCLNQIKKEKPKATNAPKLGFEADSAFPGMANVLKMKYNEKFGRHFIATRDIDVGKVIMVEEAFITTIVMETGQNICDTCFKHMTNFIACQNCTFGLFCDEICAEDDLHIIRCGRSSKDDNDLIEYAIRSILCVLDIFPTVDDWMRFVENVVQSPKNMANIPHSIVDQKSKYRLFLTLNLWLGAEKEED